MPTSDESLWPLSALRLKAKGKRSNDLYKSHGSQGSYPADARQGSKCWGRVQSPAGEKLRARGAEEMSPYPWKWKTSTGVGGGQREGHPSTTANSLETITPSRALSNETAAVAITDVSYFMAMISFLVQKKKKMPFYSRQDRRCLLQP